MPEEGKEEEAARAFYKGNFSADPFQYARFQSNYSSLTLSSSILMRTAHLCARLLFFHFVFCASNAFVIVQAFVGTYGINYGRIAENIPPPDKVVTLLRAAKIKNVRIYDADHGVLAAFNGTGLEIVVGLGNEYLKDMSADEDKALSWVEQNVRAFLPHTRIVGIAVGNEVLGGNDQELWGVLLGAIKNVYTALDKLGMVKSIQISTAHSQAVFANSFPPSSCVFGNNAIEFMKPLLQFFMQIGSPFCLNAYPFLSYMSNPDNIDINYALFRSNEGIFDSETKLHYDNLLDAQIDGTYSALDKAGFSKMEVIVTETGWASQGDPTEAAATFNNARTFNYNLRKRLAKRKGTPLKPKNVLKVYIFAVFNEDLKPGPTSERNFGLFKADGSITYDIGFSGLVSSSSRIYPVLLKAPLLFPWVAILLTLLFRL